MRLHISVCTRTPGERDVGELLLQTEDVPAHLLDAVVVDAADVHRPGCDDGADQGPEAFENVAQLAGR